MQLAKRTKLGYENVLKVKYSSYFVFASMRLDNVASNQGM
jgi:hypothetical protein